LDTLEEREKKTRRQLEGRALLEGTKKQWRQEGWTAKNLSRQVRPKKVTSRWENQDSLKFRGGCRRVGEVSSPKVGQFEKQKTGTEALLKNRDTARGGGWV